MRPRGRPMRADGPRPTLIYDGECGFCRRSVDLLRRWDRKQDGGEESLMTAPVTTNAEAARNALRQVKDPELDMNIIDLGLVYDVEIVEGEVRVKMTLTSPGCPAGPMITNDAYRVLRGLEGVKDVDIEIVWEPYWTPERMDPKVRALMGL